MGCIKMFLHRCGSIFCPWVRFSFIILDFHSIIFQGVVKFVVDSLIYLLVYFVPVATMWPYREILSTISFVLTGTKQTQFTNSFTRKKLDSQSFSIIFFNPLAPYTGTQISCSCGQKIKRRKWQIASLFRSVNKVKYLFLKNHIINQEDF